MNDRSNFLAPRMRIYIVSDHPVLQLGWSTMLSRHGGFDVVGSAAQGSTAIDSVAAAAAGIDIMLVDTELPDMAGVDLVRALLPLVPALRFALLEDHGAAAVAREAPPLERRTCRVPWRASTAELAQMLRSQHGQGNASNCGDAPDAPDAANPAGNGHDRQAPGARLTQRERELLSLMGLGLSNQQIAERLRIAMPTVKFHVTHILSKMGADNRTEAVLLGLRHGLVQLQ